MRDTDRLFVAPFKRLADFFWRIVDVGMVDGLVNWVGRLTLGTGQLLRGWQSGQVRAYALWVFGGAGPGLVLLWASLGGLRPDSRRADRFECRRQRSVCPC